ncbi:MAG: hypothetical protein H6728_13830 [Myxococcales bacterium]|nr:hypothetical protein [Myxococcales bacterium]MCB9644150.1 hypothetical protein [Myxococcales bacterium]
MGSVFFLMACVLSGCASTPVRPAQEGFDLGSHRLTVYWLAREGKRRRHVALYRKNRRLAWVSRRFAKALRLQGSGRLRDGRLVQYAGSCQPASDRCLVVRQIDRRLFPMGVGASGMPLSPFRSVAVDTRRIPLGTRLYIPALRRLLRKAGVPHHGCFIADDRGGRIKGSRLDLFVGNKALFQRYLAKRMPRYVRMYTRHPRCERLPRKTVARR